MESKKMGLCQGRHDIAEVTEYIFPTEVNPLDLDGMMNQCHNVLSNCDSLDLYVTGLTVALITVINYCCRNHIALILWHYDRDSGDYYSQAVATQVHCHFLKEAGYGGYANVDKNLDGRCM